MSAGHNSVVLELFVLVNDAAKLLRSNTDRANNRVSQTSSSILQAINMLPKHKEIMTELEKLRIHSNADQAWPVGHDQDFLRQFSTLNFIDKQKSSYNKRHARPSADLRQVGV